MLAIGTNEEDFKELSLNKHETELRKRIVKELRENNALVFCIVGHVRQEAGWPDTYICHSYWQGFIEFKGADTKIDAKQKEIIKQLNRRCNNTAFVVRFANDQLLLQDADSKTLNTLVNAKELLWAISSLKKGKV